MWHMEKEQWKLLWDGEKAFWEAVPKLVAAGHVGVEGMAQSTSTGRAEVRKIPPLARVNAEEGTQTVRILVARGLTDTKEQIRHTMQRWLDMVDWRAVRVGSTTAQRRLSVEWYLKRGAGQVRADHPARTWVERQEGRAVQGTRTDGTLDARACAELMQKAIEEGGR